MEGFLKLVRNHGPCSPHGKVNAPSLAEILKQDHLRLNLKRLKKHHRNLKHSQSKSTNIPLKPLDPTSTADSYVINVFLGTPKRKLTLIADTGSDFSCGLNANPVLVVASNKSIPSSILQNLPLTPTSHVPPHYALKL